jgi:hypothetical protein
MFDHHLSRHHDVNVRIACGFHVRQLPQSEWIKVYELAYDAAESQEDRLKYAGWYMGHAEAAGAWG